MINISQSHLVKLAAFISIGLLSGAAVAADGVDLHRMWDDRCVDCHGHAGQFARKSLSESNGELSGRHHSSDLQQFMRNHYLADTEVDAVYGMLLAQVKSQARFKDECSGCHGSAADFVRSALELRDGVLYIRESGRPVRDFLGGHRGLSRSDVEFFTELLGRVAGEVYRP